MPRKTFVYLIMDLMFTIKKHVMNCKYFLGEITNKGTSERKNDEKYTW